MWTPCGVWDYRTCSSRIGSQLCFAPLVSRSLIEVCDQSRHNNVCMWIWARVKALKRYEDKTLIWLVLYLVRQHICKCLSADSFGSMTGYRKLTGWSGKRVRNCCLAKQFLRKSAITVQKLSFRGTIMCHIRENKFSAVLYQNAFLWGRAFMVFFYLGSLSCLWTSSIVFLLWHNNEDCQVLIIIISLPAILEGIVSIKTLLIFTTMTKLLVCRMRLVLVVARWMTVICPCAGENAAEAFVTSWSLASCRFIINWQE